MPEARELDQFDRALLALLQADALLTGDALARQVALSPSAIARRIRRMRSDGTIAASRSVLAEGVEPLLAALIEVVLARHAVGEVAALIRELKDHPAVQMVVEVTGPVDVVLLALAPDMAGFNAFADAALANHPAVARYEMRLVKRRHKFTTEIPLTGVRKGNET